MTHQHWAPSQFANGLRYWSCGVGHAAIVGGESDYNVMHERPICAAHFVTQWIITVRQPVQCVALLTLEACS